MKLYAHPQVKNVLQNKIKYTLVYINNAVTRAYGVNANINTDLASRTVAYTSRRQSRRFRGTR